MSQLREWLERAVAHEILEVRLFKMAERSSVDRTIFVSVKTSSGGTVTFASASDGESIDILEQIPHFDNNAADDVPYTYTNVTREDLSGKKVTGAYLLLEDSISLGFKVSFDDSDDLIIANTGDQIELINSDHALLNEPGLIWKRLPF